MSPSLGPQENVLYQYSTASALMAGVASKGITLSELLSHGGHGLGTMKFIQGEVVFLDGVAYHLHPSGSVNHIEGNHELPFAMVTRFSPKTSAFSINKKEEVLQCLLEMYPDNQNRFMAFRIRGKFESMTARVVQGQKYERQPLSELGDAQKVTSYSDISGDIVGFWAPKFMDGVSVAGIHMHFLSDNRKDGGHILNLKSAGKVEFDAALITEFHLALPDNPEFDSANLATDGEALHKVEG